MYGVGTPCHNIGLHRIKNLISGTRVPVLVFEIAISGDYKHDIVYGVGTPCHNIGFHRIKILILGTRVPVLVFEIAISGDYKHDIVYGVGTPCHNIGLHRIKILILGTRVPVLVFEIIISGEASSQSQVVEYNIGFSVFLLLNPTTTISQYWEGEGHTNIGNSDCLGFYPFP